MSTIQLCKSPGRRIACIFLCCALTFGSGVVNAAEPTRCIVQAENLQAARNAVIQAGGAIANDLKIIRAVNAILTAEQRAALEKMPGVKIIDDQPVKPS